MLKQITVLLLLIFAVPAFAQYWGPNPALQKKGQKDAERSSIQGQLTQVLYLPWVVDLTNLEKRIPQTIASPNDLSLGTDASKKRFARLLELKKKHPILKKYAFINSSHAAFLENLPTQEWLFLVHFFSESIYKNLFGGSDEPFIIPVKTEAYLIWSGKTYGSSYQLRFDLSSRTLFLEDKRSHD